MRALNALVFLLLVASVAAARHITRFDLFNANTGKRVRALRANDTISAAFPFTVVAVTAGTGPVSSVTFTKPRFRRVRVAPYALGGHSRARGLRLGAVALKNGRRSISAYVGNRSKAYTISVTISRSVKVSRGQFKPSLSPVRKSGPRRGPLPGEAIVDLGGKRQLPIPLKRRGCKESKPTWKYTVFDDLEERRGPRGRELSFRFAFCYSDKFPRASKVRVRLLSYREDTNRAGARTVYTRVLDQKLNNPEYPEGFYDVPRTCFKQAVYLEFCARDRVSKRLLCDTSPLQTIPPTYVSPIDLKHRPPIQLKLAPGDNFLLTTSLAFGNGFSNTYHKFTQAGNSHALVAVLEQRHRNMIEKTKISSGGSVVNNLRARNIKKVSAADNGATLYVRYSEQGCPANFDNTRKNYNTTILVSSSFDSLVKLDSALPTFKTPIYPKTPYRKPVEVTVYAKNVGGGKRYSKTLQSEQPTELHYQWYLQTEGGPGTAEPLLGQTRPTLKLKSAECAGNYCGRNGCTALLDYYVDVCNTFGCRRSGVINPRVLAPSWGKPKRGEEWDSRRCEFVRA